jgi:TRAP-type mannitol/chloroaromatic compound transport system substrate-binding protein
MLKQLISTLGIAVISAGAAGATDQEGPVVLDVASTFPTAMPILGDAAQMLSDRVGRMSEGQFVLRPHEPNELVPAADTVNAVADGRVGAAWAGAGWFAGRDSAFNMFSSVPFGPGMGEYLAWMYHGGGLDLAREMFAEHGVYNIPCGIIPPEASGWFKSEIQTVDDLNGLRMRFFGLGARIMNEFGVETQQLAPGNILAELRAGRLDATEFSLPAMDQRLGFQEEMQFYYFPGWHQQATLFDLYVSLPVWQGFTDSQQAMIETACGDVMREMISEGEARQWTAMQEMQEMGVELRRWPAEILVAFEDAWLEIVEEEKEKNPNFDRVWESYVGFRENYAIWRHFSFLQ